MDNPYNDRDRSSNRDRDRDRDRNRDHSRTYDDRNNKRSHDDEHDGRDKKRPKQDHHNNRNGRPQQSQDGPSRNRNKKQEHRNDGGAERTPRQVDAIKDENRRLKAELNALKASIAHGDSNIQNGNATSAQLSHSDAYAQLPAPQEILTDVALYTPFTVADGLPQLPPVTDEKLRAAVFKHKSIYAQHQDGAEGIITYEKLEYLGDAYLELFASRLIYHRFPQLAAGQMSQDRETLVKNETLARFSKAYGFDKKVQVDKSVKAQMEHDKANKGFNKVLGDVFEAYVAAVALSHEDGFAAAEKWLTALWAPKVLELFHAHKSLLIHADGADPLTTFNPNAAQELSARIGNGRDCKLDYKVLPTIELKDDHLGQNLWIMELYIDGYGHTHKLLARGQGANKKEAKAWAAIKAMHGENKYVVEECEAKCRKSREQHKAQKEMQVKQETQVKQEVPVKQEKDLVGSAS
ncbi:Double-strand-specific pac1 ribonuclease [Fulvia fulva]|uniref:ribonuclease III n=1 Tax=Passalora fulva TaxID=5499 RepID=A0A9Q8PBF6_PASFU|nr:Double-strand-specific pac1 ribonuclease [Fulvia fulva]KAK4621942.1 Double-strand-specific pac1 ribonuclease [Fulvia fulva]KAK4622890.1 Double-strand-specific pac1 ribonuclease [Fulvia fulva]UJO19400.1 Double-strand-specific pac1 ribonuclease [Fulvia fulva]WPV16040.1 Double-strand-specific pac1 ribonuclease [Fulvia fulva]WPV31319.1 Double-strand-specific pac1 ribonuclease [Fulvia fulva]